MSTSFELSPGEFTIGRSSGCNLAVADGLVSRKHAILHVGDSEVVIEDNGSRNGVLVNGEVCRGPRPVHHMDRIYIGAQELVLIDDARVTVQPDAGPNVICDACGAVNGSTRRRCGDCGRRLGPWDGQTQEDPPRHPSVPHAWGGPEDTLTETTRDVIDGIAAKAIDLGRYEEAERILLPHMDRLLERARTNVPLSKSQDHDPEVLVANAARNALALAQGLHATKWIDWVFRIYTATGHLMQDEQIESLHALVRTHDYRRGGYVRTYVQVIQSAETRRKASERFRVRRLEGLAEMILARSA